MIQHNGYTFRCSFFHSVDNELTVKARTERTAIEKARGEGWDVVRVRVTAGVRRGMVARGVRLVCCPGCVSTVGVTFR